MLDAADVTAAGIYREIISDTRRKNGNVIGEENIDAWVQYSYVNMGLHKVKKEKYKDWVELATSFDE
ncbi:hypothetical protein ACSZNH_19100 [Aeromonas dhakensis]|uniref:hypothetical protein n=1 Tax=Aeromonas dhakensis TaxID=196024 RepID=UPI003EC6E07C